jgi:hypothetical protein
MVPTNHDQLRATEMANEIGITVVIRERCTSAIQKCPSLAMDAPSAGGGPGSLLLRSPAPVNGRAGPAS